MRTVTPDLLESLLSEYGWMFEALGEGVWRSGFLSESRKFPVEIKLGDNFISFTIAPLIKNFASKGRRSPAALFEVLALNNELKLARLSLTESGDLRLTIEVLVAQFDAKALDLALGILAYYAEQVANRFGMRSRPKLHLKSRYWLHS